MIRWLVVMLFLLVVAPACSGDDPADADAAAPDAPVSACDALPGTTYRSVDELECGLGPSGPVYCRWQVVFAGGSYDWSYSDIISAGDYTCDDGVITGTDGTGNLYTGTLGDDGATLVWDGVAYARDDSALTRTSRR